MKRKEGRFGLRVDRSALEKWRQQAEKEGLSLSAWITKNCDKAAG